MLHTIALGALLALASSHGTLVITIETKEGIVMCADRREYNRERGASDNQDKMFKLSTTSVFSYPSHEHQRPDEELANLVSDG
jgi:hypothetical protein